MKITIESIYTDNGYRNREDYLKSLADEFGVSLSVVKNLANILGPNADFDELVAEVEDASQMLSRFPNELKLTDKDITRIEKLCRKNPYVVVSFKDNSFNEVAVVQGYDYLDDAERDVMFDLVSYETCSALYDNTGKVNQSKITRYDCDNIDWNYFKNLSIKNGGLNPSDANNVLNYFDPNCVGVVRSEDNIKKLLDMTKVK